MRISEEMADALDEGRDPEVGRVLRELGVSLRAFEADLLNPTRVSKDRLMEHLDKAEMDIAKLRKIAGARGE